MRRSLAVIALCSLWLCYGCAPASSPQNSSFSRPLERQVQAQQQQIDTLTALVSRLENQIGENQTLLNTIQQDIEQLKSRPQAAATTTQTAPAAAETNTTQPSATEIYRQAFADYTQERYTAAERGFSEFLRLYPENPFAATACFRLAQSQQAQGKTQQALSNYAAVVNHYPDDNKAAEALYNMAVVLKKNNQPQHAQATLNRLIANYPDSPAAKKAEAGLASLKE
nr:tol-pal system protein YbgF [uncultured Desulfuromonas sp.]